MADIKISKETFLLFIKEKKKLQSENCVLVAKQKRHNVELMSLRTQKLRLTKEVTKLKRTMASKKFSEKTVKDFFQEELSGVQIRKLVNPRTHQRGYTTEDISQAVVIKSISPKCFRFLRKQTILSLPSDRTIGRWLTDPKTEPAFQVTYTLILLWYIY